MSSPIPLPAAWIFVPGVALLARAWLGDVFPRAERRLLVPLVALVIAVDAIHVASLVAESSHVGVWVGLGVPGASGYVLAYLRKGRADASAADLRVPWSLFVCAAAAMVLLVPAIFSYNFHDETPWLGHLSMTAGIENGWYPPRHSSFPEHLLRYHYGFDLIAAVAAGMLGLRTDHAIDLITLLLAGYSVVLAWPVARRLSKGPFPVPLVLLVLLAAGLPFLAPHDADFCRTSVLCEVQSMKWVGTEHINPPLVSGFFQHPFTLGIPITLGALAMALVIDRRSELSLPILALLTATLAALSISQMVLYAGLWAALAAFFAVRAFREHAQSSLLMAVAVTISIVPAYLFGGFFAPAPTGGVSELIATSGGVAGSFSNTFLWLAATFGLALPLGLLGLRRLAQGRLLFLMLVGGNLVVLNSIRYQHSWDIVKFATAAHFYLALASIETLRAMMERGGRAARALAWGAFAITIAFGISYVLPFWAGAQVPHWPAIASEPRYPGLSDDDAKVLEWLRAHVGVGELVYRSQRPGRVYAQLGGLPQVWIDGGTEGFGVSEARLNERRRLESGFSCESLLKEGVDWVVLDGRDSPAAHALMNQLEATGVFTRAFERGDVSARRHFGASCPPSEGTH